MPLAATPSNKKGATKQSISPSPSQAQPSAMKTRQAIKKAKEGGMNAEMESITPALSKIENNKNARAHFSKEEKEDENRAEDKRRARNPTPKKLSNIHLSNVGENTEGDSIEFSFGGDDKPKKLFRKKRISQEGSIDGSIASVETTSQRGDTSIARRRGGENGNKKNQQRKPISNKIGKDANGKKDEGQAVQQNPSKQDESFVSEVNAASSFHKTLPKASSPILQSKSGNHLANSKKPVQEKKEATKAHRGIVAEMYEHERRIARMNNGPNTAATPKDRDQAYNRKASGNQDGSRSILGQIGQNVPTLNAPPTLPLPYGLPGIPASVPQNQQLPADANLSPFGISPYAEPGTSWTTNVYVNNLPPHTSDEDLLRLGSCFGRVKSHKAIINQETGLCKGYGFIMYEFLHDAELAIQQLPLHGLATSWAKESFSSKLRRMADSTTSNVYLSNLPQDITPAQLEQLFTPHEVISLRILTDSASGKPRGVGFVRLRDRFAAQSSIERLNGMVFPSQETPLQARFADSEAQKQFKLCARTQLSKEDESGEESTEDSENSEMNTTKNALPATTAPAFAAALKGNSAGQHTWTGFATPASQAGNFSPLVGFMSPAFNMSFPSSFPSTYSPQVANGGLPAFLPPEAFAGNLPYDPMNIYAGRFDQQMSHGMPIDPVSQQRLDWLSLAQQQQQHHQNRTAQDFFTSPFIDMMSNPINSLPIHGSQNPNLSAVQQQWAQKQRASSLSKSRQMPTTYLPPDLAIQHARALMEKSTAQHAATAAMASTALQGGNMIGLTQQHVEHERAGLLKMLKEASENLAKLRNDQEQKNQSQTKHETQTENDQASNGSSNNHSNIESGNRTTLRRSSNPQMYFGTNSENIGQQPNTTPIGSMRTSVSATSLSPLRFLYSQDPKAPISVEAIDLTTNVKENKSEGDEDEFFRERVPTPMPMSGKSKNSTIESQNDDLNENKENILYQDHPSTVLEEDKDNTTACESDAQNSSYTSAATTTSTQDEEDQKDEMKFISSDVLHKSDSGKGLDDENKDSMVVKLVSNVVNLSPPHGIMMIKNSVTPFVGAIGNGVGLEKRNRSKSVVIHAPFDDVPVSPSQGSVMEDN